MSARRTIGVVIGDADHETVGEALRASVGLTLRGDQVAVALTEGALTASGPDGERAARTLAMFGHPVRILGRDAGALDQALAADVVEAWGAAALAGRAGGADLLHLVRAHHRVAIEGGRVLHLASVADDEAGSDAVLDAVLAAGSVVLW